MRTADEAKDMNAAEKAVARRPTMLTLYSVAFVILGLSWVLQSAGKPVFGTFMEQMRFAAWMLWGITILLATFGPRWGRPTETQLLVLNDELTAAHRASARTIGYWLALAGLIMVLSIEMAGGAVQLPLIALVSCLVAVPSLAFCLLQSLSARNL